MDYLIADAAVIPPESDAYYAEKIIRLPHCYLPQDSARVVANLSLSRANAGLPERGFVFCCFNHSYKITPEIFDVWMHLLRCVPDSVLWLNQLDNAAQHNLRREAEARQVAAERVIFAPFVPDDSEHLGRLRVADLFLDTPGYNAHATASDALWAGVPVLTVRGHTFPGRVGASLLQALGMDELIAPDLKGYEELALLLARDPARLSAIRRKLAENSRTQPLFNTAAFTRDLEWAYANVVDRLRQGPPLENLREKT
jgi:protein O-GlcNAc transferase